VARSLGGSVVVAELVRAFRPPICAAEVYDYQKQLRYRVYGANGHAMVSVCGIHLCDMRDPERLRAEIERTRTVLEGQWFRLDL